MKKLSIAVPVYNEEKNVIEIINRIKKVKFPLKIEIIIVDDGSTDKTAENIKKIRADRGIKIKKIYHKKNSGKGAAIRTAISRATGDVFVIQDADLEYNPEEIPKLIEHMQKNNLSVVYGSRILNKKNKYSYLSYYLGNLFLNIATNILFNLSLTDMETCYKLIKSDVLKKISLNSDKFNIEPEITAKIALMGYKIEEIPISYNPRTKEEGKKIKWSDGTQAILTLLRLRFF
ncbi:MAG: glycosyltransferase family 2 protein [Nanoarchaeota archaeon]